jgi:hypothetical protein
MHFLGRNRPLNDALVPRLVLGVDMLVGFPSTSTLCLYDLPGSQKRLVRDISVDGIPEDYVGVQLELWHVCCSINTHALDGAKMGGIFFFVPSAGLAFWFSRKCNIQ